MKSFCKVILIFVFSLSICFLLFACRGGLSEKIDHIQGTFERKIPAENLFVAPDYNKNRPLSVAILPFENLTQEKEASDLLQRLFYNNFSSLAYKDIELGAINANLPNFNAQNIFENIDPTKTGELLSSDALIIGRITEFESYYAGVEGTAMLNATFSISPLETTIQMQEKTPGTYIGSYIVRPKDTISDGVIVVHLSDSWNNVCRWEETPLVSLISMAFRRIPLPVSR